MGQKEGGEVEPKVCKLCKQKPAILLPKPPFLTVKISKFAQSFSKSQNPSRLRRLATKELTARTLALARQHTLTVNRVTIRNQRSRWGSCSRRGTISLNWRLIQMPDPIRDYVILHELAHTREHNHSQKFWRLVEELCPDYREAKAWIRQHRGMLR